MENHELGHYYTLGHLTQFTGFTDRTLRNYLARGILEGEKINGVWHFTEEQLDAFFRHPAVRPSLIAKKNATVYDFLLEAKRTEPRICVILDLPGVDREAISKFFCDAITGGSFHDLRFSFDGIEMPRLILSGRPDEILPLVNSYKSTH